VKEKVMNSSSTQIPFMLAGFIAVVIYSITSEPNIESKTKTITTDVKVSANATAIELMRNQEVTKIASIKPQ
jgi:hypothetical protein